MTHKTELEPIDREKAKEEWNDYMKRRTQIRKLIRQGFHTSQYRAKLSVYNLLLTGRKYREVRKIVIQYLKGLLVEKPEGVNG